MFDRRVKIFLLALVTVIVVLLIRAVQVQVLDRNVWTSEAVKFMSTGELIETSRGKLLDRNGHPIAEDSPCIDASVDYRAILLEPDAKWVNELAVSRVRARFGTSYRDVDRAQREQLVKDEGEAVRHEIKSMWETLATLGNMTNDQMDELRRSLIRKVEVRRRWVWYRKYQQAMSKQETRDPAPWYRRWLYDDSQQAPELDQFDIPVAEQLQPHIILSAISNSVNNFLGKNLDHMPGLILQASVHRTYPYRTTAAQVIGHLAHVSREDLKGDPNDLDELRAYLPNDLIGRSGLEALCEPLLRGSRGKVERYLADSPREVSRNDPLAGRDVRTTIDIELQGDIQELFKHIVIEHTDIDPAKSWKDTVPMPGAAVVLDVQTNQVLAMVSAPTYDLNTFDDDYLAMVTDDINRPLMNRATQFALEPGSTVKPMVGIGAITQGVFGLHDTIECTGYLQLNGRTYKTEGRCWVASNFYSALNGNVSHHPIPYTDPSPTGFLEFPEGLERSCNVFFETLGDRLHMEGLRYWFTQFGLGQKTGVGINETSGSLPGDRPIPSYRIRAASWFSAIGQDQVLATPIQMANVAATIARGGIWKRPQLLMDRAQSIVPKIDDRADTVDLHLNPDAVDEAKKGMVLVANALGGTGQSVKRSDMIVAAKTGSAQAAPLKVPIRDEMGRFVYKTIQVPEEVNGVNMLVDRDVKEKVEIPLGTHAHPNPLDRAPWYRGTGDNEDKRSHAWIMGFAPADHPKIAFAVMVEYGGGGGATAGWVAKNMLDALIDHGYLQKNMQMSQQN